MKHWQQPTHTWELAAAIARIDSPAEMLECLVANYALVADRYGQHQTLHDQIWQRMQQLVEPKPEPEPLDRQLVNHRWSVHTVRAGQHAMQWLQCTCGWKSSAVADPGTLPVAEWTDHVAGK